LNKDIYLLSIVNDDISKVIRKGFLATLK
jgi:hypothetical protein